MSSRSDRKKQERLHPAVLNAKLDAEVWRDPRDWAAEAVWVFWHRPYFELCPENSPRGQNQRMRGYLSRYMDEVDVSGEAADSHLGSWIGLRKGKSVLKLKLMEGDVGRAEDLAKQTGRSFEECIEIYSYINILNTPSFEGGEMIAKVGGADSSAPAAICDYDQAVAAHAAAARGNGIDPAVTKAHVDQTTNAMQLEMVKACRSRPIAYGDLGIINMMRHGRP